MKNLIYRPEAAADVESAFAWYERQRTGLGDEFLDELRSAERVVRASPEAFRVIRKDTRRYLFHRFPYQLLYRVVDDKVVVVACFHARRSPRRIEKGR